MVESPTPDGRIEERECLLAGSLAGFSPDVDSPLIASRFQILGPTGTGGQKQAWLALDLHGQRNVVLSKIPRGPGGRLPESAERELRIQRLLGPHSHVVEVYETLGTEDAVFLVSPHLPGGDLATRLASAPERRLPIDRVLAIAYDLALALAHTHGRGVVHGDVSPGNVLLDADERACLSDFGLARQVSDPGMKELRGTPGYLAPETIRGEPSGFASDLYAFGCVIFEALAGRPPFVSDCVPDLLRRHQLARPPDLRELRPDTPRLLATLVHALMAKDPARRPESAVDVVGALWGMKSSWSAFAQSNLAPDEPRALIGREAEQALLRDAIEDARKGLPSWVLFSGRAGLGKTRLARQAAEWAHAQGFTVLYVAATKERRLPHVALVEALIQTSFTRLGELAEDDAKLLRQFLYLSSHPPADISIGHRMARWQRLRELLAREIDELCARTPLALVIEDLHEADRATLELLLFLAQARIGRPPHERTRLLVLGTYRPAEASAPLIDLARAVESREGGRHRMLSGFEPPETRAYLVASGAESVSLRLAEEVTRASEGSPFLLRQIARPLASRIGLEGGSPSPDSIHAALGPAPSAALDEWIAGRLEGCTPACVRTLSVLALGGAELGLRSLEALLEAAGLSSRPAIDAALETDLVLLHQGRIQIRHAIIRDALVRRLEPGERQALHLEIALAWQKASHRDPQARDTAIAHHLFSAGDLANADEVVRIAEQTARQALDRSAWPEAIQLLEYGLERAVEPETRARLHWELARVHFLRLDATPCLHHYGQAQRIYGITGNRRALASILAASLRATVWLAGDDPRLVASSPLQARCALEALERGEHALKARLLCALAEYELYCGKIPASEDLATSALALMDEETDPLLEADVGFILGSACHSLLRPKEGLAAWERGAAAARAAGDRSAEARCLQRVAMSLFCFGRIEAFERERERLDASEALYYSPGDGALAWSIELELAAFRGDWAATERHGVRVRELVARSKNPWSQLAGAYALACARATQGDGAGAREALDWTRDPSMPFAASNRSDVLDPSSRWLTDLFVGEPVGLSPSDRDAWIERIGSADETSFALACACFGVEMADRTRDTELAAAALPIMTTADARSLVLTVGWPFFVPRLLGVAATLVGDWALADGTFERATACAARLGFPIELGRTRLDHAQMLVLRNGDGDRDRARHLARLARSDLSLCPRNVFAGRAEKLCDYLQVADAPADPAPTHRRIADERLPGG